MRSHVDPEAATAAKTPLQLRRADSWCEEHDEESAAIAPKSLGVTSSTVAVNALADDIALRQTPLPRQPSRDTVLRELTFGTQHQGAADRRSAPRR